MRDYEKQLRHKQVNQAKLEDKIKDLTEQIQSLKKPETVEKETINLEEIKLSKLKADEKLEEFQRKTTILMKSKEQDYKLARMNKKLFEAKTKELEEKIKQLEETIKAKDKEIKMQSIKIKEIMAINSPEKKMQKIKE